MRLANAGIAVRSISHHVCGKQLSERGPASVSLLARKLLRRFAFLKRRPQSLDEALVAQQNLSLQFLPRGGLLQTLSESQVRDLFGYLMSPVQVPLPSAP